MSVFFPRKFPDVADFVADGYRSARLAIEDQAPVMAQNNIMQNSCVYCGGGQDNCQHPPGAINNGPNRDVWMPATLPTKNSAV